MNNTNTGGQAFPHYPAAEYQPGMTLRDYFAAKAMQGIMSDADMTMSAAKIAEWAYMQADAMLKARE